MKGKATDGRAIYAPGEIARLSEHPEVEVMIVCVRQSEYKPETTYVIADPRTGWWYSRTVCPKELQDSTGPSPVTACGHGQDRDAHGPEPGVH